MSSDPELNFLVPHVGKIMEVPDSAPKKGLTELDGEPIFWEENIPRKAALKFIRVWTAGTSRSWGAIFENTATGHRYQMKGKDFNKLIVSTPAVAGVFVTEWKFRRCGRHIYICEA